MYHKLDTFLKIEPRYSPFLLCILYQRLVHVTIVKYFLFIYYDVIINMIGINKVFSMGAALTI